MAANSNFLPGINVTLNDLGLKIAPPPAGPKVMLLGITSNTGIPLKEPFTVSSVERATSSLYFTGAAVGSNYPGELSLAVEEASQAGAQNIEVMVIAHQVGDALENYVSPTGHQTGRWDDLSGAYDILKNRDLDVVVPVGAYIDATGLGMIGENFGKQLADFCFQVTSDENAAHGVIGVAPPTWWALHHTSGRFTGYKTKDGQVIADELRALGGVGHDLDQFNTGQKYTRFGTPSSTLIDRWVDYHTADLEFVNGPFNDGIHVGGDSLNRDTIYGAYLSGSYDDALGGVRSKRFADAATSNQLHPLYFTHWQAKDNDGALAYDGRGVKVDAGAYISVINAPLKATSTQARDLATTFGAPISSTSYITDGVAAYAGLVNSLAPHSATTNKHMPGVLPLKQLSRTQANRLVGLRKVTMYTRSKGYVVSKDVTGAHNVNAYLRSDYVLLTTVRIVQTAVDLIRSVAEDYIGEPNNAPQMNSLNNEVDQVLLSMKGSALNAYDFVIRSTPAQRVLGELDIDLTLVPAFEITTINLTVSLASSL